MAVVPNVSASEVRNVLKIDELIVVIEKALGNYSDKSDGGIVQPVRQMISIKEHKGLLGVMPGYSAKDKALATKLVTVYPENKDLPTHSAVILAFNPANGALQAIIDGDVVTEMRTAAASAIASKYLANPNSRTLAILGSGHQARSHYKALTTLFTFDKINIWSRTLINAQKLATEIGPIATACNTVQEAVFDADIIVTVTFAIEPILKAEWVKTGAHINAVGACKSDWSELEPDLMNTSVVYCDSYESAQQESGDIIKSGCKVYAEIGEVVNGTKEAYTDKTTVFKSLGLAIEDVVSAKLIVDKLKT